MPLFVNGQTITIMPDCVSLTLLLRYENWYRILILFLVSSSLLTFTAAAQQKNTDTERALVLKLAAYLKDSSYIKNTIRQIETEKKVETQITGYQKLHKQVQRMLLLQSELKWLNMEAIRLAYEDMKRIEGFDAVKYLPILTELEQQMMNRDSAIYIAVMRLFWQMRKRP